MHDLTEDEWEIVANSLSMATRAALIGVCRSARNGVVRSMRTVTSPGGGQVRLLADQAWARVQTVLLGRSNFITGSAGVGKTMTSSAILDDLKHNMFKSILEREDYKHQLQRHEAEVEAAKRVIEENSYRAAAEQQAVPPVTAKPAGRTGLSVLTTATTGAAAQLIGGQTLHSAFNIRAHPRNADEIRVIEVGDVANTYNQVHENETRAADIEEHAADEWYVIKLDGDLKARLATLEVLVIDEVSMLDSDLLDLVDLACRRSRKGKQNTPFGGICVLFVGDFCQLAPVIKESVLSYGNHGFAFEAASWKALRPVMSNLTVPVRQDPALVDFIGVLQRARFGRTTKGDMNWLIKNSRKDDDYLPLLLTTREEQRTARNEEMLERHPGQSHVRDTSVVTRGEMYFRRTNPTDPDTGKPYNINDPRAWTRENTFPTFPLRFHKKVRRRFEFKVGARVRCTKNVSERQVGSLERSLVVANGAVGEILGFSTDADGSVDEIRVRWDRASHSKPSFEYTMKPHWYEKIQDRKDNGLLCKTVRLQFPLELCWAKTIHSAQGASIHMPADVCIDRNKQPPNAQGQFPKIHGIIYTAISRFSTPGIIRFRNDIKNAKLPFYHDDMFCEQSVRDFYKNNTSVTPAWVLS